MARPADALFALQWHLDRATRLDAAFDLNVLPVWEDYTGRGVAVAVYDTKVQGDHPDLDRNYDPSLHIPGLANDLPFDPVDNHGTPVAGIIGAERNGDGVVGVAYGATLTGAPVLHRNMVDFPSLRTALEAAWRFDVVNMSLGTSDPFGGGIRPHEWAPIAAGYAAAALQGRNGLGTIVVNGSGNHRSGYADANLSYFTTERTAIVVGAVAPDGTVSSYSVPGASVFIAGLSGDSTYWGEITTTDRTGADGYNPGGTDWDPVSADHTTRFGGTSAATPMVSGVVALMLEANPRLGWRDVQDILAITARHAGTEIGAPPSWEEKHGWTVNDARHVNGHGFHFSPNYGFGLVDALAAVRLAETWDEVQTSANEAKVEAAFSGAHLIPDHAAAGTEIALAIPDGVTVERVQLRAEITHGSARQLRIALVSPSGTESVLFDRGGYPPDIYGITSPFRDWTFGSNAFRGEEAAGTWRVRITDLDQYGEGTVRGLRLEVYGDAASTDDTYYYTNEFGRLAGMAPATALSDGGGVDTINAAAVSGAALIDLRAGATSTINGVAMAIAPGTAIENAVGGDGDDTLTGNAAANHLRGARGDDDLRGGTGDDRLDGGPGRDSLIGGSGADTLDGGAGDDTHHVDHAGDVVIEAAGATGGAADRVIAGTSWALGPGSAVELILAGSAAGLTLSGNELANRVIGAGGDDRLNGAGGDDVLAGGPGSDTLLGGAGTDTASYATFTDGVVVDLRSGSAAPGLGASGWRDVLAGVENAVGGSGSDLLRGNGLGNRLAGGAGNDTLGGAAGGDTLIGGAGDDIYIVDSAGDIVIELAGQGRDTVRTAVSLVLGSHLDDLALIGSADLAGTGNGLANRLIGNTGANILNGLLGDDRLFGGAGDDTLHGHLGNDTLTGGAGADAFVFNTALSGATNVDTIADFDPAHDTIRLENAVFAGLAPGVLAAAAFRTGSAAADPDDRVIHDPGTGALLFDADGSGAGLAVRFASMPPGVALTGADFLVV